MDDKTKLADIWRLEGEKKELLKKIDKIQNELDSIYFKAEKTYHPKIVGEDAFGKPIRALVFSDPINLRNSLKFEDAMENINLPEGEKSWKIICTPEVRPSTPPV